MLRRLVPRQGALSRLHRRPALNFALRAESGFERNADEITAEERREHLVRQMSRWRVKSSTLEFIADPAAYSQHHSVSKNETKIGDSFNRKPKLRIESEASL